MNTDTKIENRKAPWNKGKLVYRKVPESISFQIQKQFHSGTFCIF